MSEERNNPPLFAVIRFTSDKLDSSKLIDLVPYSWIYEMEEAEYRCLFPDESQYRFLDKWLTTDKMPDENWESYAVSIIAYAKDLKQGKRRLKRALQTEEIKCTDDDLRHNNNEKAVIISKDSAAKQLDTVYPFSNFEQSTKRKNDETKNDETKKNDETISTETQYPLILDDIPVDIFNVQPISDDLIALQDHIDAKFEQLRNELISQITSVKRSILYDLERKITEIKHTIVAATQSVAPQPNMEILHESLGIMLPTVTLNDFLSLEDALRTPERKKSLMGLFSIITAGECNMKDCIGKMMKSVMGKSVELEYSGTGRVIHGQSKKNFSGTMTYQCIRDVLVEKFTNTLNIKKLPGQVGVWLSGAGDREGGRKQRVQQEQDL